VLTTIEYGRVTCTGVDHKQVQLWRFISASVDHKQVQLGRFMSASVDHKQVQLGRFISANVDHKGIDESGVPWPDRQVLLVLVVQLQAMADIV
jgi:hypothetical protein